MGVTITYKGAIRDPKTDKLHEHIEGTCLSTDVKPTDWPEGSALLELDTKKVKLLKPTGWD